jgi:hypothetical protein
MKRFVVWIALLKEFVMTEFVFVIRDSQENSARIINVQVIVMLKEFVKMANVYVTKDGQVKTAVSGKC